MCVKIQKHFANEILPLDLLSSNYRTSSLCSCCQVPTTCLLKLNAKYMCLRTVMVLFHSFLWDKLSATRARLLSIEFYRSVILIALFMILLGMSQLTKELKFCCMVRTSPHKQSRTFYLVQLLKQFTQNVNVIVRVTVKRRKWYGQNYLSLPASNWTVINQRVWTLSDPSFSYRWEK